MRAHDIRFLIAAVCVSALAACGQPSKAPEQMPSATGSTDILKNSPAADWRAFDPENTLYMDLPSGRVVIALAPDYAPNIIANIKALVRDRYFDSAAIIRAQDNYVVQWARPEDAAPQPTRAKTSLPAEFARPIAEGVEFTRLMESDAYAGQVGFSSGFPVGRSPEENLTWLAHCYGMVGVGRDNDEASGAGQELYAVIGEAPRHLDRNVTLVGRVVQGMELLSTLKRGSGDLGFYQTSAERTPILRIRVAADLPEAERVRLEYLRTDSKTFQDWVQARRFRTDEWFKYRVGHIGLCNVPLPVRAPPS